MGSLYLSPKGRIGPAAFQQAAIVLIVIGFVINILPMFSMGLGMILGLVGLVLVWPWLCIWIKRLHDAGKSGWMVLLVIVVLIILNVISSQLVNRITGFDQAAMQEAMVNAKGGFMGMISASAEMSKDMILPRAIASVVVGLIVVFGGNMLLKSDPEENQYGPVTK